MRAAGATPRWLHGYQAAAQAADPVVGPGTDGSEARTDADREAGATHAFDPARVVAWDAELTFDLDDFVGHDRSVRPVDAEAAQEEARSLGAAELDALELLRLAAEDTVRRMRDVLVSPTHAEGRITAFLTTWAFEQYWTGRTCAALLRAAGRPTPTDPARGLDRVRLRVDSHLRSVGVAVRTNVLGEDAAVLTAARGLLDARVLALLARELGTLARDAGHPALADLAGRLAERQDVYAAFHHEQVRLRVDASVGAGVLLRAWTASARWEVPGARYAPPAWVRDALAPLLRGEGVRGRVLGIDRELRALSPVPAGTRGPRADPGRSGPVVVAVRRLGFGRSRVGRAALARTASSLPRGTHRA